MAHPEIYDIARSPRRAVDAHGSPPGVTVNRVGSMFTFFFTPGPGHRLGIRQSAATPRASRNFFHFMLERGIYLAPSQFEAGFISAAHSEDDIQQTVVAMKEFFEA